MLRILTLVALIVVLAGVEAQAQSRWSSVRSGARGHGATLLTASGGRVAVCKFAGCTEELIAFDRIVNETTNATEIFTMALDGSSVTRVTGTAQGRGLYVGQPVWDPGGTFIVYQFENENSAHGPFAHVSWGCDNDLYRINKNGTGEEKIYDAGADTCILHPHINAAGTKIVMARRDNTGVTGHGGPDDENEWDGWSIQVCDYDAEQSGTSVISNCTTIQPNDAGFYEPGGITSDNRVVYSYGAGDFPGGIYAADLDGSNLETISDEGDWFEEFGNPSPADDDVIAFASSRVDPAVAYPPTECCLSLRLDLFVKHLDTSSVRQATRMNAGRGWTVKAVPSDFDWSKDGDAIIFSESIFGSGLHPRIWKVPYP